MLYIEDFKKAFSLWETIKALETEIEELKQEKAKEKNEKTREIISRRIEMLEYSAAMVGGTLAEVEDFISKVEDAFTQQILYHRFLKGETWIKVASAVGGYNSDGGVRKIAERYLEKNGIKEREKCTEEDKSEMVGAVLAALPDGDEVSY